MPTTLTTTPGLAAMMLDALLDQVDSGASNGTLKIYTGTAPDIDAAATGTLLATCELGSHMSSQAAFGSASGNPVSATGETASQGWFAQEASAIATGTAGYFRLCDKDGNAVLQGTVGTSGEALNLDSVSIVALGLVTITSFVVTFSGIYPA